MTEVTSRVSVTKYWNLKHDMYMCMYMLHVTCTCCDMYMDMDMDMC